MRQFRFVSSAIVLCRCVSPDLSDTFGVSQTTVAGLLIWGLFEGNSLSVSCLMHDFGVLAAVEAGESKNQVMGKVIVLNKSIQYFVLRLRASSMHLWISRSFALWTVYWFCAVSLMRRFWHSLTWIAWLPHLRHWWQKVGLASCEAIFKNPFGQEPILSISYSPASTWSLWSFRYLPREFRGKRSNLSHQEWIS